MNKEVKKEEKEFRIERKACPVCHGMGVCERPNGDTYDCPNRRCKGGFLENKVPIKQKGK